MDKKRWLAALLTFILVFQTLAGPVWAEEFIIEEDTFAEEMEETEETAADAVDISQMEEASGSTEIEDGFSDGNENGFDDMTDDPYSDPEEVDLEENGFEGEELWEDLEESATDEMNMETSEAGNEVVLSEMDKSFLEDPAFSDMAQKVFGTAISSDTAENTDEAAEQYQIAYVAGNSKTQETSYSKGSYENPYGSLTDAVQNVTSPNMIAILRKGGTADGENLSAYTGQDILNGGWPSTPGTPKNVIIISQAPDEAYLSINENGWSFFGNVGLYNVKIQLQNGASNTEIYANGHTAVFGGHQKNNLTMVRSGNDCYPVLFGAGKGGTFFSTDLYVYGGSWARIYGAGSGVGSVTDSVNLTIDGSTGDGENSSASCVNITDNSAVSSLYTNTEQICGGAAVSNDNVPAYQICNINLTVSNLNLKNNSSVIAPNGGNVTGTANMTLKNSQIARVRRGQGNHATLTYNIENSRIFTELNLRQVYSNYGAKDNAGINVTVKDSIVCGFTATSPNGWDTYECNKFTKETYTFRGCTLSGSWGVDVNFRSNPYSADYSFLDCKGGENCTLYISPSYKNFSFSNTAVKIFTQNLKNDAIKYSEGRQLGLILPENSVLEMQKIALDGGSLDVTGISNNISQLVLNNGAELITGNRTISKLAHETGLGGILTLLDGSQILTDSVTVSGNSETGETTSEITGNPFLLQVKDLQTNGKVVMKSSCENATGLIVQKDGTDGYFYCSSSRNSASWILSKEKIEENTACIYLDGEEGNDAADGTLFSPVKTLERAYDLINAGRNTIVLKAEYHVSEMPQVTALPESVDTVKITANDGWNDFQTEGKFILDGSTWEKNQNGIPLSNGVTLPTNTTFDNIIITKANLPAKYPTYIRAAGHKLIVGEHVTLEKSAEDIAQDSDNCWIGIQGNGTGKPVDQVDLDLSSGAWYQVSIGGDVGTNADYGRNKINETTIAKIILNKDITSLFIDSNNIYGSLEIQINGKGGLGNTYIRFNKDGNYYGNVSFCYSGDCSLGNNYEEVFRGNFYGKLTYDASKMTKCGYYYPVNFYGNFYGGAYIDLGSNFNLPESPSNVYIGKETELGKRVGDFGTVKYETLICKPFVIHTASKVNLSKWIGIGSGVSFEDEGKIVIQEEEQPFDIYSLAKDSSKVEVEFLNNTSGVLSYSLQTLKGVGRITLADETEVSYAEPYDWSGTSLVMGKNSSFYMNGSITLNPVSGAGNESENDLVKLGDNAKLTVNGKVEINGNITAPDAPEKIASVLWTGSRMDSDSQTEAIQLNKIGGMVTGWLGINISGKNQVLLLPNMPGHLNAEKTQYSSQENGKNGYLKQVANSDITFEQITYEDRGNALKIAIPDRSMIYLDPANGDDAKNSGLTQEQPVKTLQKAYELLENNGTIVLMNDLTLTDGWKGTYNKPAHITGYDSRNHKFYDVTCTYSGAITVHADTWFECMKLTLSSVNTYITAAGYQLTFGVPQETFQQYQKECEEVKNFETGSVFSVYGSNYSYNYPTKIVIHSGSFQKVDPWTPDNRNKAGEDGKLNSTVIMTGGKVNNLGRGSYTGPRGIARYILSGGTVTRLGAQYVSDYARGTVEEEYDISGSFYFENFYYGNTCINPGTVTFNIHDLLEGVCEGVINCGTQNIAAWGKNKIAPVNFKITVRNASVERIQSSGTNTFKAEVDKQEPVNEIELDLEENAVVKNLYAGSSGTNETAASLTVNFNSDSAQINRYYDHGFSTQNQISKTVINVCSGGANKINFLNGKVQEINVSGRKTDADKISHSTAVLSVTSAPYIGKMTVASGNAVYLPSGSTLKGTFAGSEDSSDPSILYVANAANLHLEDRLTGKIQVIASIMKNGIPEETTAGFRNGLNIYTNECNKDNGAVLTAKGAQLVFGTAASGSNTYVWHIADSEDTPWRNAVYVGMDLDGNPGNDTAAGTASAPVLTLAKGYEKAAEQYMLLLNSYKELKAAAGQNEADKENLSEDQKTQLSHYEESLKQGIRIVCNGSVAIGEMEGNLVKAALTRAVENGLSLITVEGTGSTDEAAGKNGVIFSDDSNVFIVPVATHIIGMTLQNTCVNKEPAIFANGNKLEIGDTVKTEGSRKFSVYGGCNSARENSEAVSANLTVNGGNWGNIYGGGSMAPATAVVLNLGGQVRADHVYGGGQASGAEVLDGITLTIEGGSFSSVYGGGYNAETKGMITLLFHAGTIENLYGGGYETSASAKGAVITIGNEVGTSAAEKAAVTSVYRGAGQRGGYSGGAKTTVYAGAQLGSKEKTIDFCAGGFSGTVENTEVIVEGGIIYGNLFAGGAGIAISGSSMSETEREKYGIVKQKTTVTLNGGTITGNVFAGGNNGVVEGSTNVIYNGGTIGTDSEIFTEQADETSKEVERPAIYGGGNAAGVKESVITINGTLGKDTDVYGGSRNVTEKIRDIQKVSCIKFGAGSSAGNVFGGSNLSGNISDAARIEIPSEVNASASLYGGGNQASITGKTEILVQGSLTGNVFGGGKGSATVSQTDGKEETNALLDANTPETNVTVSGMVTGNVFGGGEYATVGREKDSQAAAENADTQPVSKVKIQGTVKGRVYGGGKGEKGKEYARVAGNTSVDLEAGGTVLSDDSQTAGFVFGGGQNAPVSGDTQVNMKGGTYKTIFGGNDVSGSIMGIAKVIMVGGQADSVYGGGYGAGALTDRTSVQIQDGTVNTAYAGGNEAPTTNAEISVTGGTVDTVFGGGNAATVTGTAVVKVETKKTEHHVTTVFAGNNKAEMEIQPELSLSGKIKEVYCGGNEGIMTARSLSETNTADAQSTENQKLVYRFDFPDAEIENVYGGCRNTSLDTRTADVELIMVSGTYEEVYGGNNENGCMDHTSVIIDPGADNASNPNQNTGDASAEKLVLHTVYGGGNHAAADHTSITVKSGTVTAVYGGGNAAEAEDTSVWVKDGSIGTLYGGGNQADTKNVKITAKDGTITTLYGGGNSASVTESVQIETDKSENAGNTLQITDLYCGNNAADMTIVPEIRLKTGKILNFYGGGNEGLMNAKTLSYMFDSDALTIDNIYGGGNKAGVNGTVTLTTKKGNYTTIYGGSNSQGTVRKAVVNIQGNVGTKGSDAGNELTGKIFGGGKGSATVVEESEVNLQAGVIAGNVYGGSGFGTVGKSVVCAKKAESLSHQNGVDEAENGSEKANTEEIRNVQVLGNVYGAGYGESSSVGSTNVVIDLDLVIAQERGNSGSDKDFTGGAEHTSDADVIVKEMVKDTNSTSGESYAAASWKTSYQFGSYIEGNVFGGGDMGQVGSGHINASTNTADILEKGETHVEIQSGYINGNVFGGGNGQPGGIDENGNAISGYTLYMGTIFGTSYVEMTGGYVNGSLFGCGQQSRTYSDKDASYVTISSERSESDTENAILIGGSIFGGGNKGNGSTQNASVATVYGDTHVTVSGNEGEYTPIYLLSTANSGGGVYGDGNLCLVSGKKYVSLKHFSCGVGADVKMLKTFYSLQRADVVDLTGSRIVLLGAIDLVADNTDDTLYSLNRVGQLNLKENSTVKVTKMVNLLSELTSDEQPKRQFIDRGNNTGNANVTGNAYTAHGGGSPAAPLNEKEVQAYIQAYEVYMDGTKTDVSLVQANAFGTLSNGPSSINVVCVANGGYLEIKKSATEYGPVTGLFTLQLVNANPGEGGGFVYADIMGKRISDTEGEKDKYVTGNFVCVTKASEKTDEKNYMYAYHNVGGKVASDGKYEYYVWYLKGNKYNYDVDLTAYIGTSDTDFTRSIFLPAEGAAYKYVLIDLLQDKSVTGYEEDMFKNTWSQADAASDKIAVEMRLVKTQRNDAGQESENFGGSGSTITEETTEIGFLGYKTEEENNPDAEAKLSFLAESDGQSDTDSKQGKRIWGIWRKATTTDFSGTKEPDIEEASWKFQAIKGESNSFEVASGDFLGQIDENTVGVRLEFILHKGTGMTTEFRNLPFDLKIAEVPESEYNKGTDDNTPQIQLDSCVLLTENITLSAIRLVPSQAAYLGSGRMFGGVSSSATVNITNTSAFTAQFITKYIPSAFTSGNQNTIKETLVTSYTDTYLVDENGVGYTIQKKENGSIQILNMVNARDNTVNSYTIKKDNDSYYVEYTYKESEGSAVAKKEFKCTETTQSSGFILPKGTVVTLLASIDEGTPSYWYYYCTEDTKEIPLEKFRKMNTANTQDNTNSSGNGPAGESVYDTISSKSSNRITENMIFAFDFSNVSSADWKSVNSSGSTGDANENGSNDVPGRTLNASGNAILRHTYTVSATQTADIMDYVSVEKNTDGTNVTETYTHELPKQTDIFHISSQSDGIESFDITSNDGGTYEQKDVMHFQLNINPDNTITNTQFEERQYAVRLSLKKVSEGENAAETEIAFPEGTTFIYNGQRLALENGNRSVIVPVKSVGTHLVTMNVGLAGLEPGTYKVTGALYSTSATGYYNSIAVNDENSKNPSVEFQVEEMPVYSLQITEEQQNHLAEPGGKFYFVIKTEKIQDAQAGGTQASSESVDVNLYRFVNHTYKLVPLDTVLDGTGEIFSNEWSPSVLKNAAAGTYRLEFNYHDRTEYWDFIIGISSGH